jgi:hypothetical protein
MAFSAKALLELSALLTSPQDLTTGSAPLSRTEQVLFAEGVGANQANRIWSDTRTLGASATEDLDLAGAALLDPFGVAVVFARIKFLYIKAAAANTNSVLVGGVAAGWDTLISPAATGVLKLPPGAGFAAWAPSAAGFVVTATTADLLHVANSAGSTSVTYDVVAIGAAT